MVTPGHARRYGAGWLTSATGGGAVTVLVVNVCALDGHTLCSCSGSSTLGRRIGQLRPAALRHSAPRDLGGRRLRKLFRRVLRSLEVGVRWRERSKVVVLRRLRMLWLAWFAAVLLAVCGGGGQQSADPVTEAPRGAAPTPAAAPPAITELVGRLAAGDVGALLGAVRYEEVPCVSRPLGIGGPPVCPRGVPEGTALSLLPVSTCEAELWDGQALAAALARLGTLEVMGVFRWPGGSYDAGPVVLTPDHVALFALRGPSGERLAFELLLEDGAVVGLKFGCGEPPEELAERQGPVDR